MENDKQNQEVELLTPAEVKKLLRIKPSTRNILRGMERRGLLRAIRITRQTVRYFKEDVMRLLHGTADKP